MGWSQKANKHCQELIENSPHLYDFGDGWSAKVSVRAVDAAEARKVRKVSQGFCGYDWMVQSLSLWGDIKTKKERWAGVEVVNVEEPEVTPCDTNL